MSGIVENSQINSCSYEDYSDSGLPFSTPLATVPVEPALDLTPSRPDHYSEPLRLPLRLSAHDNIRIADGQGGSRTLELIELVREARTDAGARAQLLSLAQAAASDPRVQSSCFVASEENLLPILAQIASSDPTVRREGALSLKQFIRTKPEDRRLQQGLLATVDQIARNNPRNQEARDLLVAVYQDRAPQNSGLRQWMQSHTAVASYAPIVAGSPQGGASQGLVTASSVGSSSSTPVLSGSAILSGESVLSNLEIAATLSPQQALSLPSFAPLAALIEERTQGTPLQGLAPEGVIGFALANASLPAAHFNDLLYLRIMAAALPLNGFTGNLYGQSMIVATSLAHDIRRQLQGKGSTSTSPTLVASDSMAETRAYSNNRLAAAPVPSGSPSLEYGVASPDALEERGLKSDFPSPTNFFVPSLVTSLSGMQGLAYYPAALGPSAFASQTFGLGGPSHYTVEGPTSLDEGSHQGFGGGSQGQGSDEEGQEESSHPQDGYYA